MVKNISMKFQNTQFFCQKYWQNAIPRAKATEDLLWRDRLDFTNANKSILGLTANDNYSKRITRFGIKHNDLIMRATSERTKNNLTVWRGIPKKINNIQQHIVHLYNKCVNLKKGDILYMPEYSFWATKRCYALERATDFSSSKSGILYELTLPKGYNLYKNVYPILPRASQFKCISNTKIKCLKKDFQYNLIKLELLPRVVKY